MKAPVLQARAFLTSLTLLIFASTALANTELWIGVSGTSATTNWSDLNNWQNLTGGGGAGPNGNDVLFNNTGAVGAAGQVNNVVDQNGLNPFSLSYTNGTGFFHTTLIPAGVTVTDANGLNVGFNAAAVFNTSVAITGPGELDVNGTVQVGLDKQSSTTLLDMSGLGTFKQNSATGQFLMSFTSVNFPTVNLATNSTINVATLAVEDSNGQNGRTGVLNLGSGTNIIEASTIHIGLSKGTGTIQFPGGAPATAGVSITGTGGGTARAGILLGQSSSGSGSSVGNLLLAGHPANVLASTMTIANRGNDTGNATGTVTLDNGTLDATTILVAQYTTNTTAKTSTGTLTIGGDPLNTATLIVNSPGGPGGGTFVLSDNTYISGTSVGTLNLNANGTALVYTSITKTNSSGGVNTATLNISGGTLNMEAAANTIGKPTLPIDNVNLNGATLNLNVVGGSSTPVINAVNLTASGVNTLDISVANVNGAANIPLIAYTGADPGTNSFVVNVPTNYVATLDDNGVSLITLNIVPAGVAIYPLLWVGAVGSTVNGNWNYTTANWVILTNGAPQTYTNPDLVTFDDSASNATVNLTANLTPETLTFSNGIMPNPLTGNPLAYTLTGAGSIGGSVTLVDANSGSVTLQETGGDDFTGGVSIGNNGTLLLDDANSSISGGASIGNGATLQIGNNDANGNFPTGAVIDNGTLIFDRTSSSVVSSEISGSGNLIKAGSGSVTLTVSNEFTGTTTVTNGTLILTGAGSLAANNSVDVDSNATLDVTAVTGVPAFQNLTLGNCTLNQALANQQSITLSGTLTVNGSSTITINVTSLPIIAAYPTILTNVAGNGLNNGGGTVQLGSLPAGFTGQVGISNNAILLTLTSGPTGVRPDVIWSGADSATTTNWSDAQNWQLPGVPTSLDNIIFNNTAAAGSSALSSPGGGSAALNGNFNNIVDTSFTVNTLTFTNLGGTYHNTVIASGATLTVTNTLTVGAISTDGNASDQGNVTVSGSGGALSVANTNGNLQVWYGNSSSGSHQATLDLSALDNFRASISRLAIGASVNNTVDRVSGIVYLARTNNVAAGFSTTSTDSGSTTANGGIVVGDANSNAGSQSQLWLGEVNNITADSIGIGRQKAGATLKFDSIYANVAPYPSVVFQGLNGNPVTAFEVGNGAGNSGTTTFTADADLTGGFVTANIATLNVGRGSTNTSGSGTITGSLEFDAGSIMAGTVNIGLQTASNSVKYGVGTITVNTNSTLGANATLSVSGSLNLGLTISAGSGTSGTLNIGGGTVLANAITAGTNGSSTITLNANGNGGILAVTNGIGLLTAPLGTLNLEGGTLQLGLNASNPNIWVYSLNISAPTVLNIASINTSTPGSQQITLINYLNLVDPGIANLTIGSIPFGYSAASLTDDGVGHIYLQITAPPALTWAGATSGGSLDGNWNTTDLNWKNGGSFAAYVDPDFAIFNDTASNFAVNVTTTLTPGSLTVNNSASNYVFSGSGKLSGVVALNKSGTASLTLNETGGDNFSAGITVNAGAVILDNANSAISGPVIIATNSMLQIGNNDANGNLPGGNISDNGALVFDQSTSNAAAGVISGTGSVTNNGSGTVTLSANNTVAGGVTVNNGTIRISSVGGGNSALGPGVTTVNAGGTLIGTGGDAFGFAPGHNCPALIVINGGTVTDLGTANYRITLPNLQFTGGTLTSAPTNNGDASGNYSLFGNATNCNVTTIASSSTTTISAASISIQSPTTFNIASGTTSSGIDLLITAQLVPYTTTTMPFTKSGAGVLALDASSPVARNPITNSQGTLQLGTSGDSTNLNSPMGTNTVANNSTLLFASGQSVTVPNAISGTGNLVVNSGTAVLTGASTYSGNTTVNGGVLSVTGSSSASAITVAAAGTLTGTGSINSATVNGTVAPGTTASTGTLTASSSVALSGNTLMKLNTSTNDVLAVGGTLTYRGTLTLTNISGTPLAAGNSFKLFSAGAYNGTFGSIVTQPPLSAGLGWNNSAPGVFTIVSTSGPSTNASITRVSLSGTNLLVHGTNNNVPNTNFHYVVLSSTNLNTPLSNWFLVATNSFNLDGTFDYTNPVVPGTPRQFIRVKAAP